MELNKLQRGAIIWLLAMDGKHKQMPEEHLDMIAKAPVAEWPPELVEIVEPMLPPAIEDEDETTSQPS